MGKNFFKKHPNFLLVILDLMVIVLGYVTSIIFLKISLKEIGSLCKEVIILVVLYEIILNLFHMYKNMIMYEMSTDYIKYIYVGIIIIIITTIASKLFIFEYIGLRVNALSGALISGGFIIYRLIIKGFLTKKYNMNNNNQEKTNLLIVGAGFGAKEIITSINNTMANKYNIVGLIDDDLSKQRKRILDNEVIGNRYDIERIVKEKNVQLIFIAIHNISNISRSELVQICQNTGVKTQVLPSTEEIINKNILMSLRDVQIEDLLGREPIKLSNKDIGSLIKNKIVLITGAGGSIGSELCRQIISYQPKELLMFDIYENTLYDIEQELKREYKNCSIKAIVGSICSKDQLNDLFENYKPQLVFHAAAHKHVPLMETVPIEAIRNNVFGTLNVANCADEYKTERFILISTDKAVNPTNIMGATKRLCEMIIQAKDKVSKTQYCAVRFGNVLGSNGSVIPLFKKQIASGGPLTVTHKDITRFFMTIPEAVSLILQAITYAKGGEIFVLDMGKPVKIYDLAENLIKLSGYKPNVDIEIKITGLRPGEKLYEELLMGEEGLSATKHGKIFVSEPSSLSYQQLQEKLDKLQVLEYSKEYNENKIKEIIKEIVPTFREPNEVNHV